jgi:hypothetical protein
MWCEKAEAPMFHAFYEFAALVIAATGIITIARDFLQHPHGSDDYERDPRT